MGDLTPPPQHCLIRTTRTGWVWHPTPGPGHVWLAHNHQGITASAPWDDLAGGAHGPLELLVPAPYTPGGPEPDVDALAEHILEPTGRMMLQLAAAAASGMAALMRRATRDAYRAGYQHATNGQDPDPLLAEPNQAGDTRG